MGRDLRERSPAAHSHGVNGMAILSELAVWWSAEGPAVVAKAKVRDRVASAWETGSSHEAA